MVILTEAASNIQQFEQGALIIRIATLEGHFRGADKRACELLVLHYLSPAPCLSQPLN
jgi:hypothetical protein